MNACVLDCVLWFIIQYITNIYKGIIFNNHLEIVLDILL